MLGLLLGLCLPSCMAFGVDLAPSTIPLDVGDYTVIGAQTEGTAWSAMVWFLPLSEQAITAMARDRAIANAGADALINVSVGCTIYMIPLVTIYSTTVRGIPVALVDK